VCREHRGWFDVLSEKGNKGFREAVVHGMADYQFRVRDGVPGLDVGLRSGRQEYSNNVVASFRGLVAGMLQYFDASYAVFKAAWADKMPAQVWTEFEHGRIYRPTVALRSRNVRPPDSKGVWLFPGSPS
jgi:hypothetical protein